MNNFITVLRMATRSRGRCALLVACSLGIGVLWGANIGILYPFLEALFYGETIPESVRRKIVEGERSVERWEHRLHALRHSENGPAGPLKKPDVQTVLAAPLPRENRPAAGGNDPAPDAVAPTAPAAEPALPVSRSAVAREITLLTSRIEHQQHEIARQREWLPLMDRWLPARPYGTILLIAGFLVGAALLRAVLMACNDILVAHLTQRAMFQLRCRAQRHLLTLDLEYFTEDRSPKILSRFTHDAQRVGLGVSTVLQQSLREPFKMIACLAAAAWISWQLLLFSLLLIPFGVLVLRGLQRFNRRANEDSLSAMSELYSVLTETLQGIRLVRGSAAEGFERRRFQSVLREIRNRIEHAAVVRAIIKPAIELMGTSVVVLAILAGGWLVLNRQTVLWGIPLTATPQSPAALLVFFGMLLGATDPLRKMAGLSVTVSRSAAAADRVFQILEREPRIQLPAAPVQYQPAGPPAVAFRGLTYRYRGREEPALQEVTLEIAPGECVAVIGANGSGKTTLLNLLLRFFDPSDGTVEIDGTCLTQLDLTAFRRQTALLAQNPFLFDDTVGNNIRYGRPWISDDEVLVAARKAGAAEFIEHELPEGLATVAGEAGNQLSGGQIQKIALARAILRDPGLLLLDEATSQLDPLAEAELVTQLKPFIPGRTTLIITHRPALLALASRIVLLDHGQIAETGTHAELLARSPLYREMLHSLPARAA